MWTKQRLLTILNISFVDNFLHFKQPMLWRKYLHTGLLGLRSCNIKSAFCLSIQSEFSLTQTAARLSLKRSDVWNTTKNTSPTDACWCVPALWDSDLWISKIKILPMALSIFPMTWLLGMAFPHSYSAMICGFSLIFCKKHNVIFK